MDGAALAGQACAVGSPSNPLAFNAFRTDLEAIVTGNFKHQAFLGLFLSDAFLALLFLLQPEHEW